MPIAKQEGERLWYVVTDHLGTPRELLSEDGTLTWAAEYGTWGGVRRLWQADNDNEDPTRGPLQGYDQGGKPVYATRFQTSGNLALKPLDYPDPNFCLIRFQGQWADEETGLYYNRFRYYDPLSAQYMSPDPIGIFGGLRKHGFVDKPNGWIDPMGLAPTGFPSWKTVNIDMTHVLSGHTSSGARAIQSGIKDIFPEGMSEKAIEAAIRKAYKCSKKGKVRLQDGVKKTWLKGSFGPMKIEMIYNHATKTIETAYPKFF